MSPIHEAFLRIFITLIQERPAENVYSLYRIAKELSAKMFEEVYEGNTLPGSVVAHIGPLTGNSDVDEHTGISNKGRRIF